MHSDGKHSIAKQVTVWQSAAFACIIALIWLDEIIDIPALLLGAPNTPVNWRESLFESVIIALVWVFVIRSTNKLFQRMKYLEGLLSICAACKRIRGQDGGWRPLETYITEQSDAHFTHGICPDCAERLYPDFNPYKNRAAG
ncbi:hypothetical protein [Candidatus Electronema sp. TJ]|uniref:hypothetical protein n=1 Tax=Candidatus Electronema sp. TJ TaxID=3401573 RepID=UPI003AA8156B